MAFNNACFHSFLNSRGKTSDGEAAVRQSLPRLHMKSGQGPQRLNLAPPVSPSRFLPQRQEVAALEADDFLWDGHALGLR